MKSQWLSRKVRWLGALLVVWSGLVGGSPISLGVGPTPVRFETEILSLSLTGTGMAPIFNPDTQQFDLVPLMMDVGGTPGRRHLGGVSALPLPGGGFQVNSFLDVFVDISLSDARGGPQLASFFDVFIHVEGTQENLSPDLPNPTFFGLPANTPGGIDLPDGPGGIDFGWSHIVLDVVELAFDLIPPPDPGLPFRGTATLMVAGEVNPPDGPFFGPFTLTGPTVVRIEQVPAPATLGLLALGLLGLGFARRR